MNSLQDIIKLHGEEYIKSKKLPSNILKALYSIKDCRTATLGGHVYECDECGETMISYNSCRNRHCPRCQAYAKELWIYDSNKFNLIIFNVFCCLFFFLSKKNICHCIT